MKRRPKICSRSASLAIHTSSGTLPLVRLIQLGGQQTTSSSLSPLTAISTTTGRRKTRNLAPHQRENRKDKRLDAEAISGADEVFLPLDEESDSEERGEASQDVDCHQDPAQSV